MFSQLQRLWQNVLEIEVECRNNVIINKLDEVKWPFDPPLLVFTLHTDCTPLPRVIANRGEVCAFMIASVHRNEHHYL